MDSLTVLPQKPVLLACFSRPLSGKAGTISVMQEHDSRIRRAAEAGIEKSQPRQYFRAYSATRHERGLPMATTSVPLTTRWD
jgi:hypothetical protein